jgi:hypothetical protein
MTKKAYFDVEWEGPEVEVDQSGNVTSKGANKGELLVLPLRMDCPSRLCGIYNLGEQQIADFI